VVVVGDLVLAAAHAERLGQTLDKFAALESGAVAQARQDDGPQPGLSGDRPFQLVDDAFRARSAGGRLIESFSSLKWASAGRAAPLMRGPPAAVWVA
jgi:hypothetical protein